MSRKVLLTVLAVSLCAGSTPSFSGRPIGVSSGQVRMDVEFALSIGTAMTNHNGILYSVAGQSAWDPDLIYTSRYWGTYPLYTYGQIPTAVYVTYTATSLEGGAQSIVRAQLVTESQALNLDGSSGIQQKTHNTYSVTLQSGETQLIDASFVMLPNDWAGLNRFVAELSLPDRRVLLREGIYVAYPVD